MANSSRMLYTGMTADLEHRVWQHKRKVDDGYTARYNICFLVYCEEYKFVNDAITCEKQIKGWLRRKKIALIEEVNPTWKDLAADWFDDQK